MTQRRSKRAERARNPIRAAWLRNFSFRRSQLLDDPIAFLGRVTNPDGGDYVGAAMRLGAVAASHPAGSDDRAECIMLAHEYLDMARRDRGAPMRNVWM